MIFLFKIKIIKKALSQIKLKEEIKEDSFNPLLNSSLNKNKNIVNKNNNNKELSKKIYTLVTIIFNFTLPLFF